MNFNDPRSDHKPIDKAGLTKIFDPKVKNPIK